LGFGGTGILAGEATLCIDMAIAPVVLRIRGYYPSYRRLCRGPNSAAPPKACPVNKACFATAYSMNV
jgi:hypothetical protein